MPKVGATDDITEDVFEQVVDSRSNPVAQVEYLDDDGESLLFDDITAFSVSKSGTDNDYNSFSLVPPSSSFNMSVFNARQKYSPGTGNEFDGVLIRDREVQAEIGYKTTRQAGLSNILSDTIDLTAGTDYHTQEISGSIYNDITSAGTTPDYPGIDLNLYDSETYDDSTYSCEGVWVSEKINFNNDPNVETKRFEVTADTTDIDIYVRSGCSEDDIDSQSFVKIGITINGIQRIDYSTTGKVFQIAFAFCTGEWSSSSNCVSAAGLFYFTRSAFFPQGSYFLDDPGFNASYGQYSASTAGRDYFKKALETKISTKVYKDSLGDPEAVDVGQIIRDIAERAGIPATTASVPNTGIDVTLDSDFVFKNVTAKSAINECVEYLNGVDENWRVRMGDDGQLELFVKAESTINADFNYTYQESLFSFSKKYQSNNFLQVATVSNEDPSVSSEFELRTVNLTAPTVPSTLTLSWATRTESWSRVGSLITVSAVDHQFTVGDDVTITASSTPATVPLGTYVVNGTPTADTFTFTGNATGTFSGNLDYTKHPDSFNPEAIFKRVEVTINSGEPTVSIVDTDLTSVTIQVAGSPIDVDITVYGDYLAVGTPIVGEAVNSTNWQAKGGITKKFINRLIQNSADAQSIAEKLIDIYGNQNFKASLNIPFDPLREIDDKITIWEKFTNTARIFAVESISHSWTSSGASARTSLGLLDLGVDFANFNWDRNNVINGGTQSGVDDIKYDSGRLWDEEFGVLVSEDTVTDVDDYRNIG